MFPGGRVECELGDYDVPARPVPLADQICAVCSAELDHSSDPALVFDAAGRFVHPGLCESIAAGRSAWHPCAGRCGTLLRPEVTATRCPRCA